MELLLLLLSFMAIISTASAFLYHETTNKTFCTDTERQTLLSIKSYLANTDQDWLSSWTSTDENFCTWSGVVCDNTTDHVTELHLQYPYSSNSSIPPVSKLHPCLSQLKHLKYLDLSQNNFNGLSIPEFIGSLDVLVYLNLSCARFGGVVPRSIGNLCNLKELDFSHNNILGEITGLVDGLSRCIMSSNYSIRKLNLRNNRLNGTIPESLSQLSELEFIDLSYNDFTGVLTGVHIPTGLKDLHLSYNKQLKVITSATYVLPFKARRIVMCSCQLGPSFPSWLQNQTELEELCISGAGISDEFPPWFWDSTQFYTNILHAKNNSIKGYLPSIVENVGQHFDVSCNELEGALPTFSNPLVLIDLSNNSFSGTIPENFTKVEKLMVLLLSHNHISGNIPDLICHMDALLVLRVSDNLLSGDLPRCWRSSSSLKVLDLSDNNFTGKIPESVGYLHQLVSLHIQNNSLLGEIPSSLKNCSKLVSITLRDNKLSGTVPLWIGENLSSLQLLCLRSNKFTGNIPENLSSLASLQLLILASNNFSGTLPASLGNFVAMTKVENTKKLIISNDQEFGDYLIERVVTNIKGQQLEYTGTASLLTSIDFGSNAFSGEIPKELANLRGLRFLNLSGNQLTGEIPEGIGELSQLESLDLSANKLSGRIPESMVELNFLGWLNLSYNNFSGRIPYGAQLQSFPQAYTGNINMCGLPLPNNCTENSTEYFVTSHVDDDQSEKSYFNIAFATGYVLGFSAFIGTYIVTRQKYSLSKAEDDVQVSNIEYLYTES